MEANQSEGDRESMSEENSTAMRGEVTPPSLGHRRISLQPLRWWWVGFAAALVVAAGVVVGWWLWPQRDGLTQVEAARGRTDAIRTGLTAAGGAGAALALLLAVRRQRATEIALTLQDADLAQKEQVAATSALDATERRITELYANAVEQLGSEKAPVRIGGLHALERLAQDNNVHRQTIVDVICAYLRMPYEPPDPPSLPSMPSAEYQRDDHREQEYQVRRIAQRILTTHLRPDRYGLTNPKYWPSMEVDLTGAYLIDIDFGSCDISVLTCNETIFVGESLFRKLRCEMAFIQGARFFSDETRNTFVADFRESRFVEAAWFSGTFFGDTPWFHADEFFVGAHFGDASFKEVRFHGSVQFGGATFGRVPDFRDARVRIEPARMDWPNSWAVLRDEIPEDQQSTDGRPAGWWRFVRVENDPNTHSDQP
jgi:hypothetical protein